MSLFESNNQIVSLPDDLDVECLEVLINFFYLMEISPPLPLTKTFQLLNLAVFFKAESLIKEIQVFLLQNSKTKELESEIIFSNSLNSFLLFQNSGSQTLEIFQKLLSESMSYLLKNNKNKKILNNFNVDYFEKLENSQLVEKSFNFFVEIFKTSSNSCSNETLMEFFTLS